MKLTSASLNLSQHDLRTFCAFKPIISCNPLCHSRTYQNLRIRKKHLIVQFTSSGMKSLTTKNSFLYCNSSLIQKFFGIYGLIAWGILWMITMIYAFKIEKYKKEHDVQSYKEIVAFIEGKRLDEIEKKQEIAKRPYQKVLLVLGRLSLPIDLPSVRISGQ